MHQFTRKLIFLILTKIAVVTAVTAQPVNRVFTIKPGSRIEVENRYGRVEAFTDTPTVKNADDNFATVADGKIFVTAISKSAILPTDIKIEAFFSEIRIVVSPADTNKRIDISITMPPEMRVHVETRDGEVRVTGDITSADIRTDTGTIAADVPVTDLRYELNWTASRPRFLSDFELVKVKEKAGGAFEIVGRKRDKDVKSETAVAEDLGSDMEAASEAKKRKSNDRRRRPVSLKLTTARGIILLNVPVNEVSSDLRERPLTAAAKAIIRSGDSLLMEAVRRAAPKYFGDYARTLPPMKFEPSFAARSIVEKDSVASIKSASVRVNDINNRSVAGLNLKDFELTENNVRREIISVEPTTTPFNLVLLLDVSGSVDEYVNFIRKAARNFVETVAPQDRISIVTFNDDIKILSGFTTDKRLLSERLDTFDAGGATAYYDSLAYTLADTLRPLKGERTAVVILTDGDDNRSFLSFDSLLSSIQESGALIYPLYVPSGLIAASESSDPNAQIDELRTRYLQGELTSKAKEEGGKLATASGGVYYPITRLSQIQAAYNDIVAQLRTAYTVRFRSVTAEAGDVGASPRLKIKVNKPNTFATVGSVTAELK